MIYHPSDYISLTLGGVLVALAAALGYRTWKSARVTPEEIERRRRAALVAHGKINDAVLLEIHGPYLFFSYAVRGAEYQASQDVSFLPGGLPTNLSTLGPICVKYDARNPANSIVIAEQWTGLRTEPETQKT